MQKTKPDEGDSMLTFAKDMITSFSERVRNRFFLPIAVVWVFHNWKISLALLYIQALSYKQICSIFIQNYSIYDWIVIPVATGILYCILSPYLSAGIFWLQKFGYTFEKQQISTQKDEELEFRKALVAKRENVQKREIKADTVDFERQRIEQDKTTFSQLNGMANEHFLGHLIDQMNDHRLTQSEYQKIRNYIHSAKTIELEFRDKKIRELHMKFVDLLEQLSNVANQSYKIFDEKWEFRGSFDAGSDYLKAIRLIEPKLFETYREFRGRIREVYGI